MSDHKFRLLPIPPRLPFFSWLLRLSTMGFALFCFEASTHDLDIEDGRPITHFLTQALFLAAPVLWAFAFIRQPRSVVEGETILTQNSPMDLAARSWWRILLYSTPAISGAVLLAQQISQNPAGITLAPMSLGAVLLTAAALFAAALCAACVRLTGGTLSRLGDGLRLDVSMFMPWEKIGSVVKIDDFYGFCAPGRHGVTISYVRVEDADTRKWLDGALTEVGARVRVRPAPLDYALQFSCVLISAGVIALGVWLNGWRDMAWQFVLLIATAIAFAGAFGMDLLRGVSKMQRLRRSPKTRATRI